ncbi:MAG: alanine--tRNA ligase, partial [Candidatus Daviesbacteria bacterium]|nr:alanine--tRNA ligase [Candidatus Daviesbacteria bacterium]
DKYIKFFVDRGHKEIAPARLVPENDPSTLFTSSGMQPLVPYLLGQVHPAGKRLVNSQPCFRAEDIEEVGDNRHTTFFEMLGNWSLGDYFKKEQLPWIWEFLTKELELPKEKLYVSVFEGNNDVPKDTESYEIWKSLGMPEDHIFFYGVNHNWWSRSGSPDKMPAGEIGGPASEVFFEFTQVEHDNKYGDKCYPNCNCGRFLEIGNSVFIQYLKRSDGKLKELTENNVDFGGGLERLTAAVKDEPDIFQTDLYLSVIQVIEQITDKGYEGGKAEMQVIADHMKAATFLIVDGVIPSNKLQGYVLRRLLRRAVVKMRHLNKEIKLSELSKLIKTVLTIYEKEDNGSVEKVVNEEMDRFSKTLDHGLKEIGKLETIDGKKAFDLYQTFGFPYEVTEELFRQKGQYIDREQFKAEFEKHRELSRTASSGMFKGGLADHSEIVTKYHTATHLLHQALRNVLGPEVFQKGSNITSERMRFDFSYERKLTDGEIKQVEDLVNEKIKEDLVVTKEVMEKEKALQNGALGFFTEKYGDKVTVYTIGSPSTSSGSPFSREVCGGPHVEHTGLIGKIKITKEEAVSAGIRRIRAQIVLR